MARDDKETSTKDAAKIAPIPGRVERALRRAREATQADVKRKAGRWLAVVPVSVAILTFLLMIPRATEPEAIPLPYVDERVLRQIRDADEKRARAALAARLPTDVLEIGSAIRTLNAPGADFDAPAMYETFNVINGGVRQVTARANGIADLLALRALQTHTFIEELDRFESTGEESAELRGLAGEFVERMRSTGWITGHRLVLDEWQRRAVFKAMWTRLTNLDASPEVKLTLDEERALYTAYLRYPHPPENRRDELDSQRRRATTPEACKKANWEEARATEMWRADKIKILGQIDPSYPAQYALGVAYYRGGRYDLATDAFRSFLDRNPDGPYSLRARNHLKASLALYGTL